MFFRRVEQIFFGTAGLEIYITRDKKQVFVHHLYYEILSNKCAIHSYLPYFEMRAVLSSNKAITSHMPESCAIEWQFFLSYGYTTHTHTHTHTYTHNKQTYIIQNGSTNAGFPKFYYKSPFDNSVRTDISGKTR